MRSGPVTPVDAVVIGGGPAGAVTARGLAQLGWHTTLIERGPRYRIKACGHCVNPAAMRILQELGLPETLTSLAQGASRRMHVFAADGRSFTAPLVHPDIEGASMPSTVMPRQLLDQALIDAARGAGVEVLQPASARILDSGAAHEVAVQRLGQRHVLRPTLIVGADGLGSAAARADHFSNGRSAGRKYGFAFDLPPAGATCAAEGDIRMYVVEGGYLGVVQQADGTVHCAGLVDAARADVPRDPLQFVRAAAQRWNALQDFAMNCVTSSDLRNFAAVGPMPWRPTMIANHRIALVGDAAGYVEPFTGQGIAWALRSAKILIDVLSMTKPGRWNAVLALEYQQRWHHAIRSQQNACRAIAFALERPRWFAVMMSVARRWPAVPTAIVRRVNA